MRKLTKEADNSGENIGEDIENPDDGRENVTLDVEQREDIDGDRDTPMLMPSHADCRNLSLVFWAICYRAR